MAKRIVLTPASVDELMKGYLVDPQTPGLRIEVGATGRKTWRYRRRLSSGSVIKLTLGRYPTFSIAAARTWAAELNAKVEADIDPRVLAAEEIERAKLQAHGKDRKGNNLHRAIRAIAGLPNAPPVRRLT